MKKIRLTALTAAIAITASLTAGMSAYARGEYAWLEAEEGNIVCGEYKAVSRSAASGGYGLELYTADEEPAQVDFSFKVPEKGSYDIKILTTAGDVLHLSKFKWSIDGRSYKYCSNVKGTEVYRQGTAAFANQPVMWYSLATMDLEAGSHTISILTDECRSLLMDYMYHYFDAIAIVPNSWQWVPEGIDKPVKRKIAENNSAWINIKDVTNLNQTGVLVQGNDVCVLSKQPEDTIYEFPVPFKAPKPGAYDIYLAGAPAGVNYASPYTYSLDGEEKGDIADSGCYKNIGSAVSTGGGLGMAWQLIEQLDLDDKEHNITFKFTSKRPMDDLWTIGLRYLILVPRDTKFDLNEKNYAEKIGEFIKSAIFIEETKATEDLALHTKAINGNDISWSSDNPQIINNKGEVNRPGFDEQDKKVTLTATVSVAEGEYKADISKSFDIIVLKKGEYSVEDFVLEYENGDEFGENDGENQILTASARIANNTKDEKSAVLILALYDDTGAMVSAKPVMHSISEEFVEFRTEMTIDSEKEGYVAEAFIWTDFADKQLIDGNILSYTK